MDIAIVATERREAVERLAQWKAGFSDGYNNRPRLKNQSVSYRTGFKAGARNLAFLDYEGLEPATRRKKR